MENIVMASVTGLPVADGKTTAGGGTAKAGKGMNGLFGLLIATEITKLTGSAKNGQKTDTAAVTDPMMALLMSALIQGNTPLVTTPAVDGTAQQTDQTGSVTEAGAGSLSGAALLQSILQQPGGKEKLAKLILVKLMQNQEPSVQETSGDSQVSQGSADFTSMMAKAGLNAKGVEGLGNLKALIKILNADALPSQAEPAAIGVLQQIKKLFTDIIENQTDTEDSAVMPTAVQTTPSSPLTLALPVNGGGQQGADEAAQGLFKDLVALLGGGDTATNAADAQGGQAAAAPDAAKDGAVKTEGAGSTKKELTDFSAAIRAYHGQTAKVAGSSQAEAKVEAVKKSSQVFDNIVESITSMQNSSLKEMEIRLKPDFLGKIVIKLSMDSDGMVAKIVASNPKVQEAFMSQATSLANSLSDQGLKDVRIVVTSSSVQDASLQQQADRHNQGQQEKNKRNQIVVDAADVSGISQPLLAYEQAYRTGTVNYLA
jgi:flagellar hook-length control protein FliK